MKQLLKTNRYFFLPYLLFLIISSYFLFSYSKPELHILSNQANTTFFDLLFKYATYLGDGIMIAVLGVIFLFISYRYTIAFLTGSLITSVIVQLFKKVILGDIYRPSKYFELYESYKLHLVDGVDLHSLHSFPSGHSATAFNVFLMLALVVSNRALKVLFLFCAVTVAYSRVYISQHFLVDILVGSFAGTLIMFLAFWWVMKWKKPWLDKSVSLKRVTK